MTGPFDYRPDDETDDGGLHDEDYEYTTALDEAAAAREYETRQDILDAGRF